LVHTARGFGTECSDSHFGRFNQPFSPSLPCYRVSYDIATQCAASNSVLSPLYWASMVIAPYTGAPAATPSAFVPITVRSIWQQPVGTTSVTSRVMISNTNLTAPSSGLTVSAPTYSTTGSGCKCSNVLYELDLTLQYSSAGVVTAAFADVVLTDVTAAFTSSPSCVGAAAVTPQTFSLAFNSSSASAAPAARSGAPGYNVGLPVLAGYSVTDPAGTGFSAVLPIASGLTVSGASTAGQCSTDTSQRLPVTFGSDMLAVCQVPLTQAQLISRCQSVSLGSSATAAGVGLWEYMTLNATSIGMFGNSVPSNAADWVTITQASPVSSMVHLVSIRLGFFNSNFSTLLIFCFCFANRPGTRLRTVAMAWRPRPILRYSIRWLVRRSRLKQSSPPPRYPIPTPRAFYQRWRYIFVFC
jgi:hypothetical protein